jgi:polyhydroxyalkanoate synthesis regulator phasin
MILEEAIKYYREKADELSDKVAEYGKNFTGEEARDCIEYIKRHEQLAEWLTELKHWQELKLICAFDGYVIYKEVEK